MNSDYRALGLSLHTECPLLAIGHLVLPEMSHTLTFIGSENPHCFTSNFLGVTDPALVIESQLINDRLPLGNIIELQTNSGGPDVVTVFDRGESGPVSQFHSVQVTLFGGVFESEATIRNDELTISTSSGSVFDYPAEMTITAPSNKTDWQDLELTVEGSLLSGDGSFTQNLETEVTRKLINLAEVGHVHHEVAQMALDRSTEMLITAESRFSDAVEHVTRTEESKAFSRDAVKAAQAKLTTLERDITGRGNEFRELVAMLDGLCTEDHCECSCMPGELCRSCTSPPDFSQCPTGVKHPQPQVSSFSTTKTTCRFEVEYVLEVNQTHGHPDCSTDETDSHLLSTAQPPTPVHHWRMAGVDMQLSEKCTVEHELVKNLLDICCENVSCAAFAPNPSCLARNRICRSVRQSTLESLEGITAEERELLQQLLDTQSALVSAQTDSRKAQLQNEMHLQRRDQLNMSLIGVREEHERAMVTYNRTLEEVEPLLSLYDLGTKNGFQNIFTISNTTFSTTLTNSPSSLVLNVSFQKQMGAHFEQHQESFLYISTQSEAINLDRIANDIINIAFTGIFGRRTEQTRRSRRQAMAD